MHTRGQLRLQSPNRKREASHIIYFLNSVAKSIPAGSSYDDRAMPPISRPRSCPRNANLKLEGVC
jgi:hypothetical protein